MKKAGLVVLWTTLSMGSVAAQQNCLPDISESTPTADFTDHGNGTVTHIPTGLMWKKCAEGLNGASCATGTATVHSWQQALKLADNDSFAGYIDWRLPSIKELGRIVERKCYGPTINLTVFPNDSGSFVWSGSPAVEGFAWATYFYDGLDVMEYHSDANQVRLVRGGQ